jgi:hypothetical protein
MGPPPHSSQQCNRIGPHLSHNASHAIHLQTYGGPDDVPVTVAPANTHFIPPPAHGTSLGRYGLYRVERGRPRLTPALTLSPPPPHAPSPHTGKYVRGLAVERSAPGGPKGVEIPIKFSSLRIADVVALDNTTFDSVLQLAWPGESCI